MTSSATTKTKGTVRMALLRRQGASILEWVLLCLSRDINKLVRNTTDTQGICYREVKIFLMAKALSVFLWKKTRYQKIEGRLYIKLNWERTSLHKRRSPWSVLGFIWKPGCQQLCLVCDFSLNTQSQTWIWRAGSQLDWDQNCRDYRAGWTRTWKQGLWPLTCFSAPSFHKYNN